MFGLSKFFRCINILVLQVLRLSLQYLLCVLHLFGCGFGYSFQRVGYVKVFPFVDAERVVGQHFYLFYVRQRGYELAQTQQILVLIGYRGHKYVSNPNGFANFRQIACAVENVLVAPPCQLFMLVGVDVLDVEKQQVGILHQLFELLEKRSCTAKRLRRCVETGVNALRFRLAEELDEEVHLQQRLAPTHRYASVCAPIAFKANGFRQEFVGCHQLVGMRIPRVWVVAILATHGATFQENDETNAWPIYRTERFDGVNPCKFLAVSTFRILCIVFYCGYLFCHNVLFPFLKKCVFVLWQCSKGLTLLL